MVTPDGWHEVRLGDVGVLRGGVGFPLRFQGRPEGDIPFYKVSDMNLPGNEIFMGDSNNYVSEADTRSLGARPVPAGSIIFAKVGAAVFLERKRVLTTPSCIDNNMMALVPDVRSCDTAFLHFALQMVRFGDLVSVTALPSINASGVAGVTIGLPPRREQEAIAEALSDADAAIEALDALIAKKRDVKQAAMQQLLTGRTRLPGFSGEWRSARLGELGEISGAGVDKKILQHEVPVRLVNYLDVYRRSVITSTDLAHWVTARPDQLRRCTVRRGDIFFTPTSEIPGDICRSSVALEDISEAVYSYHVVRLRLGHDWDLRFRAHVFSSKDFLDQSARAAEGSGTRYVVTLQRFRSLTIRYPADPAEQGAIGAVLSDMDDEIEALVAERDKMRLVKQGMMQELLSGRVRLV